MRKKLNLLVVTPFVLGGLMMFFTLNGNNELSKEEQRNRQYEVSLVKALKNTYRDIESISIKNPRYNEKPGDWSCYVELVDNDSELSQDVVFERAGMKRSTAYNHLPKLRKLVSQILDEIN